MTDKPDRRERMAVAACDTCHMDTECLYPGAYEIDCALTADRCLAIADAEIAAAIKKAGAENARLKEALKRIVDAVDVAHPVDDAMAEYDDALDAARALLTELGQ